MSFHFQRVRLKDWLVYGDEIDIRLPNIAEGRNLVVLNGQNGFGKTSLLRALQFVFRGLRNKSEYLESWNEKARQRGEGSVEVLLEFRHGGDVYTIIRGADFKAWRNGVATIPRVQLLVNGQELKDQVEDKVEQLLPRDCLDFVFFDGAEISRYAKRQHDEGVREAIEKVLGIPAVRNLRQDLKKVEDALEDEQERLLSSSTEAKALSQELEELKDVRENYQRRRQNIIERRQGLERTKTELDAEAQTVAAVEREAPWA